MNLDKEAKRLIKQAIEEAENLTSGEIRVHLQSRCGEDILKDARKVFSRLKMHRTRERNGVLIFVALKSRAFAILGDRGLHERVGDVFWGATRDIMTSYFAKGDIPEGIVSGVVSAGKELKKYFPLKPGDKNELSDKVTEA